jgi:hypothetical protein
MQSHRINNGKDVFCYILPFLELEFNVCLFQSFKRLTCPAIVYIVDEIYQRYK